MTLHTDPPPPSSRAPCGEAMLYITCKRDRDGTRFWIIRDAAGLLGWTYSFAAAIETLKSESNHGHGFVRSLLGLGLIGEFKPRKERDPPTPFDPSTIPLNLDDLDL